MARYIDADALWKQMFSYYSCINENTAKENYRGVTLMDYEVANLIEDCIDNAPTADVVPKSEYEKLIGKLECLLCHATGGRLSKHTYDLRTMETVVTDCENETYNDGFAEGYKECASEVFEEIERTLPNEFPFLGTAVAVYLAELKKKYTESEDTK